MAPVKTFQHKQQYASWLSDQTKDVMTERDLARMQAQLTGTPEDCIKANMLRNRCTRLLRTEKHCYLKLKLDKCEMKRTYQVYGKISKVFFWMGKLRWLTS